MYFYQPNRGKKNRDFLVRELRKNKIDSRPFFFPIHSTPRYKNGEKLTNAEYLGHTGMNLPSSTNLEASKIELICKKITEILG